MTKRLACMMLVIVATWTKSETLAEAACTPTSIQVLTRSAVIGAVVPVTWWIDPACAFIDTGLLLGTDPSALTPVGQPIYGTRTLYRQEIPIPESGQYWLAAYLRDEAGVVLQSPPQPVIVVVPPPALDSPGGSHGTPPTYDGTDADFLQPVGNPHFASVQKDTWTRATLDPPDAPLWLGTVMRRVSSTHRDEVRAALRQVVVGDVTVDLNPTTVDSMLDFLDQKFQFLRYPRPGLYSVWCDVNVIKFGGRPPFHSELCNPGNTGVLEYIETSTGGRLRSSARSSVTYFIPKAPPDKRIQHATFTVFGEKVYGDLSALRLQGKVPLFLDADCARGPAGICRFRAAWDFTNEARAQSGGTLELTLDPIPPQFFPGESRVHYTLFHPVDYPWEHDRARRGLGLTVTFEEDCPKALTISVTPVAVRPRLSATATGEPATVRALVKTCPPANGTPPPSVEVRFEVKAPEAGSPEAGGHAHNTTRPTGTLDRSSCTAAIDAHGMGACTVIYRPWEVGGGETITAKAGGFQDAEAKVTVQVPGLRAMPQSGVGAWRLTGDTGSHPLNHYGTPGTVTRIAVMATDYFETTSIAIGINDMSLVWGGLFDIGPPDGPFWSTPHRSHRVGKSVDIDHLGVKEDLLDKIASKYRGKRHEIDRIHYEFP